MAKALHAPGGISSSFCEQLRDFIDDCAQCPADDEHARIREAVELVRGGQPVPARTRLETLLAVGAGLDAALLVVGDEPAFMCSRSENGVSMASCLVSDSEEDVCAEGATPALALLGAWASALLMAIEQIPSLDDKVFAGMEIVLH
ncbi:hypothetical protein MTR62_11220 [Novosphingobium sp. 1949]|uniref:Uncharacterized protein n=1 Tax=Novosphingobium organovorum TaxID=2930092 RepID=A0ABT0BDY9_9SPHN|nr:hypothetical protein [Novosphingobium organovorum]MCJ2183257.1 hypothetical protein [Novosphingobium organovorum]